MNQDFFPNTFEPPQYSQFESTLFSMTSSPVSSSNHLNLPIMDQFVKQNLPNIRNSISSNPNLPFFPSDPGFAERAAKFSCFGSRSFDGEINQLGLVLSKKEVPIGSMKIERSVVGFEEINTKLNRVSGSGSNSNEGSSVSQQIPSGEVGFKDRKDSNSRKRKGGSPKGPASNTNNTKKDEDGNEESKRLKKNEQENDGKIEEKTKAVAEPPKDYIHVRARRGEATDSHSLAERVRREKISERMKLLQSLVPNCNKVTGKALMLDEIINYVQSLQRQVEFLSMKLATLDPCLDFDNNNLVPNVNQSNQKRGQQISTDYPQNLQAIFDGSAPMARPVHEFTEPFSHGFGQDDLQSIVQMDFGENLDVDTSFFHMIRDRPSNMKIEL